MKNQLDIIVTATSLLLAIIIAVVFMQTKRTVAKIAAPAAVNLAPLQMPGADVKMGSSLPAGGGGAAPGAGSGAGGGGGGGGRGRGGRNAG